MSHDRGCWNCGRDIVEYRGCKDAECAKGALVASWDERDREVQNIRTVTERRCGTCKWLHPDPIPEYGGRRMCIYPIMEMPASVSICARMTMDDDNGTMCQYWEPRT